MGGVASCECIKAKRSIQHAFLYFFNLSRHDLGDFSRLTRDDVGEKKRKEKGLAREKVGRWGLKCAFSQVHAWRLQFLGYVRSIICTYPCYTFFSLQICFAFICISAPFHLDHVSLSL